MTKPKVTLEKAQVEVEKWLDTKKVPAKKREEYKEYIETMVDAIVAGIFVMDDNGTITHELFYPTKGDNDEIGVAKLVYKPRLKVKEVSAAMTGVKPGDSTGMIVAYISAISGQPKAVIKDLDSSDYAYCQAVAIFFI